MSLERVWTSLAQIDSTAAHTLKHRHHHDPHKMCSLRRAALLQRTEARGDVLAVNRPTRPCLALAVPPPRSRGVPLVGAAGSPRSRLDRRRRLWAARGADSGPRTIQARGRGVDATPPQVRPLPHALLQRDVPARALGQRAQEEVQEDCERRFGAASNRGWVASSRGYDGDRPWGTTQVAPSSSMPMQKPRNRRRPRSWRVRLRACLRTRSASSASRRSRARASCAGVRVAGQWG